MTRSVVVQSMCFEQTFSGPPREVSSAIEALRAAGFEAAQSGNPYRDNAAEAAKAWITAEHHDSAPGAGPHTAEHQQRLVDAALQAVGDFGFELRMHAVGRTTRTREV